MQLFQSMRDTKLQFTAQLSQLFCALVISALYSANAQAGTVETAINAYDNGDYAIALEHFTPLADQGDATAQLYLGSMNEYGQGVPLDINAAVNWYTASAEQGNPNAQSYLGDMYLIGNGVAQDTSVAIKWYSLAAEQGDSMAQLNLGVIYIEGDGVAQDLDTALMWFSIAELNGEASDELEELSASMSPEQIEQAQQRAADWIKTQQQ